MHQFLNVHCPGKNIKAFRHLIHPAASVMREGTPTEIGAENVVVGDLLVLRPGSYVSADARLVTADRLSVDESAPHWREPAGH
jgi:P-type Ca2+ transporter type 2C